MAKWRWYAAAAAIGLVVGSGVVLAIVLPGRDYSTVDAQRQLELESAYQRAFRDLDAARTERDRIADALRRAGETNHDLQAALDRATERARELAAAIYRIGAANNRVGEIGRDVTDAARRGQDILRGIAADVGAADQ